MPSILDKIRRKTKRKSKSGEGYSSGGGSESDASGRASASFDESRTGTHGHSGLATDNSGPPKSKGYESLANGSSVMVNNAPIPPPVPPKEDVPDMSSSADLARRPSPIDKEDIPPRSTSLQPEAAKPVDGVTDSMGKLAIKEKYAGDEQQFHRRSLDGKGKSPVTGMAEAKANQDTVEKLHRRSIDGKDSKDVMDMDTFEEPEAVIAARTEMAQRIASEARANYKGLEVEQREIFERAGLTDNLDNRGEVEVRTEWLKPVVHETIRPIVHTEITEVVNIDRHIYHIYPKIQPIHDPDPIRLPPRHRIFSPVDGAWHEVIGDEAALAILGPAVFYNGWREYREYRAPALPGLTEDGEVLVFSEMRGSKEPAFEAREIEREGERGKLGGWRALAGKLDGKGQQGDDARMIGEVDSSVGTRTMGIKI